ncbi:MAG: amidohydrolase family protein [Armatimonadota bacterium]
MKIIDSHVHCFADEIAERAVCVLTKAYQIAPAFDGTVSGLVDMMDSAGIYASFILPVATKPSQVQPINDWIVKVSCERIIGFGAMHPEFPSPVEEMKRIADMGLPGIKFQPNWQGFSPVDPRIYPVYEFMQENGMIVYFHSGEEGEFDPEILATPESISKVHRDFPGLKIAVAHLGGYRMWDDVYRYLIGTDIYFDISQCPPEDLPDEEMLRLMRTHGMDKILFGSDAPCTHPSTIISRLESLNLTDEDRELICSRNAERLLGI